MQIQTNTAGDTATAAAAGDGLESLTYTCTAVVVADLERASDELESKGVPIIWRGKTLSPSIRSTAIRDLDGNFVHICTTDDDTVLDWYLREVSNHLPDGWGRRTKSGRTPPGVTIPTRRCS